MTDDFGSQDVTVHNGNSIRFENVGLFQRLERMWFVSEILFH